jgi:methyl-accepting chemotaxis protein
MGLLRRLVGVVVLLLSTVGILCCVAGIIGIWMLCQGVSQRVQRISDRLDVGLQRVSAGNQNVQAAVAKARADVATVGKESADLGGGGEKNRRAARAIRTLIQQQAGPDMDDLGGRLATLSDSAVAVSSLLQSFQELPLVQASRIDPDQLQRRAGEAQQLSAILRRLEVTVGEGDKETSSQEVAAATTEVDRVLENCQATLTDWQSDLDAARDDLAQIKTRILGWLTWAAIAVTVLCSWVAAGQICLFARALRWCRGK